MPLKKIKRAVKKVTKPIAKVLDKIVPNEIKPFLPFAAAVAPYLLPAGIAGGSGIGALLRRGALTGGINLASQLAQEGSEGDFSGLSLGLAGLQGVLTAPGAAETLRAGQTIKGTPFADVAVEAADTTLTGGGVLESAKNIGLEGLATGAEKISGIMSAAKDNPISMAGLKAASLPFTQGSIDAGMATARRALKDYEAELAEYERISGEAQTADDNARRTAIRAAMIAGGHSEDVISETFDLLGLKDGGRVGLREGGVLTQILPQAQPFAMQLPTIESFQQAQAVFPRLNQIEQGINRAEEDLGNIRERLGNELRQVVGLQGQVGLQQTPGINMLSIPQLANRGGGDLQGMKDGGIMDLGGKEMDLRGGGFVPIGKKERADDVPARLSKNEFVMTADAVRGAGGGNINEGARRMYETMNKLEARA